MSATEHRRECRSIAAWLFTTDHRAIGTLYLGFAIMAGTLGGAISGYMRLELAQPGMNYVVNGQSWNALIMAVLARPTTSSRPARSGARHRAGRCCEP
ncbi:hypothetical protein NKH36_08485 [Mesorhizobium sp. M1312]|uniref:hypothetical protein n=1 Tax=unclassified Mesorhizobium TaxID=325217 RepID=UPI00333BB6CD